MDDPYTLPDEDPFSCQSVLEKPVRHRSDSCSSYDLVQDNDLPRSSPRSFMSLFTPTKRPSPPRPSFSSSTSSLRVFSPSYLPTMSTSTFDTDSSIPITDSPSKSKLSFFSSLRSPSKDTLSNPKRPYPTHALSNITDLDNDEDSNIDNLDFLPPSSYRFSRASSQTSASASSSHLPSTPTSKRDRERVYFSSLTSRSGKKKRKLIVSGIGASELRKFEGIKRWCESFGELRSITRLPNGDLQIDFRDAAVADSVCRIRAKVFIAGVGSVQLSWIIGNKR